MKRLFAIPKIQIFLILLLILTTAFIHKPTFQVALSFIVSILLSVAVDLFLLKVRKINFFLPSAALVTGTIIGLVYGPNLPLYEIAVVVIIAIFSKHFIKIANRHIFNPAAFGLFIGAIIFRQTISWWSVSYQQIQLSNIFLSVSFLIILLGAYVSGIKMRRFKTIIPFLIVYSVLTYVFSHSFSFLDPTVLFFSLVMLPEPTTTPSKKIPQILLGICVAIFAFVLSSPFLTAQFPLLNILPDPLISALLLSNIAFLKWR